MALSETQSPAVSPIVLDPDSFDRMAAYWHHSFDLDQARQTIRAHPDRSVWLERARECVIVGDWRHRTEVASITAVHAIRHRRELMAAAADRSRDLGLEGIVVIEWGETLNPAFYESAGYELFDAVVPFEVRRKDYPEPGSPTVAIERLEVADQSVLDQLVDVDHAAFDWLWINSRAEFEHYGRSVDVELWGQYISEQLISYIGLTVYGQWGHIDRLAVHPSWQRRKLGNELTRFGVNRLGQLGCSSVGLSTQVDNWRSQRLYSNLGFRRADANTYRIYGQRFLNR